MKKILLFIVFLGLVYASRAQKNPREYLLDKQHEQPELVKLSHHEFKNQILSQEYLKKQQFLEVQNEKLLKNTKQKKNSLNVVMNADDRAILDSLYNATDGDNWRNNTNWLTGDGSNWYGINLDANGRVIAISLSGNHLSGSIPAELGNLPNLQELYLSNNQLRGSIPVKLENLTNLRSIDLSSNQLSGSIPAELGNLTNLQNLYLYNNQLSGSIPAELEKLTSLKRLYLYINQLSDSIPAELGNLTNLESLNLFSNQLSGSIPAELGNLTNLQELELYDNQLNGCIPAELGKLTNLKRIYLGSNQLNQSIPAELGNLTSLQQIELDSNQLSGSIPAELKKLTNLTLLNLTNNQFSGSIPSELGNLTNLNFLNLSNNQLHGSIPSELENLTNLSSLYLNDNQFTSLPDLSALTNLYSSRTAVENNSLDFGDLEISKIKWGDYAPQANVPISKTENGGSIIFTVSVDGTNNVYNWYKNDVKISGETANSLTVDSTEAGTYYCEITNYDFPDLVLSSDTENVYSVPLTNGVTTKDYDALIALYDATNGDNWTQNTDWKTTEPVDSWYGISVSGAHITGIDLSSNQLSDSIPAELGNLSYLQSLYLNGNQLTSLPDLSALVNLDSLGTAVQNNFLDFGDLETSGIRWNTYAPQAKVGIEQNIEVSEGESQTISVSVDGSNNSYQWYKNSTFIDGATDSEYTISNFTEASDTGVYVCKIMDSNYPDLTLESNNITVSKKAASAIDVKDNSQLSIYPNPVSDRLSIRFSKEKAEILKIFDLTGKQVFSRKVNSINENVKLSGLESGVYILQLKFENQTISKKIIKY